MPIPVITATQMREWEKATWASGQTEAEVIRRVGKRIARRARKMTRSSDGILILAGKGNNGKDACAANDYLGDRRCEIFHVTSPETDLPKLNELLHKEFSLIIDGLFGIGLNRRLDGNWQKLIAAVNDARIPVLAVDTPSGLDCETGVPEGAAIKAVVTATVGAPKRGMLAATAWPFVGRLEVLENVGLAPCPIRSDLSWTMASDFEDFPPARAEADHKGTHGHVVIVAGSFGFHGASVLAARAAQRAQPGLVTLYTDQAVYPAVAAQLQAVMVGVFKAEMQFPESATAILVGPGLHGPGVAETLKRSALEIWHNSRLPVVVDASALDWLEPGKPASTAERVITPHPGEAARLLGTTAKDVQANRQAALSALSKKFGDCKVVLKGHQTLIGRGAGEIFVNSSGNPYLGQGGSGDVLSGYIAGLLAQPPLQGEADKALRYAVWQHGATADGLQEEGKVWGVEDLAANLGNAR